jgi:hypothetical protein
MKRDKKQINLKLQQMQIQGLKKDPSLQAR